MKSEIQNLIRLKSKELLEKFYLLKPSREIHFKCGDIVLIEEYREDFLFAELSGASFLVRKHIDVQEKPQTYRRK